MSNYLFIIVNTSRSQNTEDVWRVHPGPPPPSVLILYPSGKPSHIYDDEAAAQRELCRLKLAYPLDDFFLFRTVATAVVRKTKEGDPVAILEPVL